MCNVVSKDLINSGVRKRDERGGDVTVGGGDPDAYDEDGEASNDEEDFILEERKEDGRVGDGVMKEVKEEVEVNKSKKARANVLLEIEKLKTIAEMVMGRMVRRG